MNNKQWISISMLLQSEDHGFFWRYKTYNINDIANIAIENLDDNDGYTSAFSITFLSNNKSMLSTFKKEEDAKSVYRAFLDALQGKETDIEDLIKIELF